MSDLAAFWNELCDGRRELRAPDCESRALSRLRDEAARRLTISRDRIRHAGPIGVEALARTERIAVRLTLGLFHERAWRLGAPCVGDADKRFYTELGQAREAIKQLAVGNSLPVDPAMLRKLQYFAGRRLVEVRRAVRVATREELAGVVEQRIREAWMIVGRYGKLADQLSERPFRVSDVSEDGYVIDVSISVGAVALGEGALTLKREIDAAVNVIKMVMTERERNLSPLWSSASRQDIAVRRSRYLSEIVGLAKVGLESDDASHRAIARDELRRVKAFFTLQEAGVVKNAYVWRLAVWSALAAGSNAVLYAIARSHTLVAWHKAAGQVAFDLRNFFPLAAGTAVGTWLSFSLRHQELDFAGLAVLEPDRLNPSLRIAYMIGLSSLVGLLVWSGAISGGLGGLNGQDAMHTYGTWALLIGLLAGVAERVLGAAVEQRSASFAQAIGSSPAITKVA